MASSSNVLVTVETPGENQVIEVGYDGQEIIAPPPNLSDYLAKQAAKIDFDDTDDLDEADLNSDPARIKRLKRDPEADGADSRDPNKEEEEASSSGGGSSEDDGGDDEADEDVEGEEIPPSQQRHWPWESVRNKLRDAFTELSVLSDVIAISTKSCKDPATGQPRRYMVLDGPVQAEKTESRQYVSLLAKKKGMDGPIKILLAGADHLKSLQSDHQSQRTVQDFHFELLRLRQNWRLKKVSHTILGDLSYRTAGSTFRQSGVFEVVKSDAVLHERRRRERLEKKQNGGGGSGTKSEAGETDGDKVAKDEPGASTQKSALRVNIPSELEGIAYIQVTIQKESEQLVSATVSGLDSPASQSQPQGDAHWQTRLEAAQNVLFCKELFFQLAREAIQVQAPIPHLVVGHQITASLFSDIQLIISLCHSTGKESKSASSAAAFNAMKKRPHTSPPSGAAAAAAAAASETFEDGRKEAASSSAAKDGLASGQAQRDHSHVLEHSLHQLLRQQHSKNIRAETPVLSTAPLGISKRRRLAGPRAADRASLLEMAAAPTLLEQIIAQAQHVVLRLRTMFVLDQMAFERRDPLISCHWSTSSSPAMTSVKVNIVTAGYDALLGTKLVIHVGQKQLTVICRDGRVLKFSHEPQELRDFVLCQIAQHQINGVQSLAKCMGWHVLSSSTGLGCGGVEPLGNVMGCLLSNVNGDRFIAVRHNPQSQPRVWMASTDPRAASSAEKSALERPSKDFKELQIDTMNGRNLLGKLELLMAALATNVEWQEKSGA